MRARMPDVLGADVQRPGGARGRFGAPTKRTINAIEYKPVDYRSLRSLSDIDTKVFVKSEQGRIGQDQSAYLKFQFGEGPQVRTPGDVGINNGAVRVPRGRELLLTQKLPVNPYYVGGRQPGGILGTVKARAAQSSAIFSRAQPRSSRTR